MVVEVCPPSFIRLSDKIMATSALDFKEIINYFLYTFNLKINNKFCKNYTKI